MQSKNIEVFEVGDHRNERQVNWCDCMITTKVRKVDKLISQDVLHCKRVVDCRSEKSWASAWPVMVVI